MITPFMDPVTRAKFRILGTAYHEELNAAIDESNIPTEYGGKMETVWHWPYPGCTVDDIKKYRYKAPAADSKEELSAADSVVDGAMEDVS